MSILSCQVAVFCPFKRPDPLPLLIHLRARRAAVLAVNIVAVIVLPLVVIVIAEKVDASHLMSIDVTINFQSTRC